MEGRDLIPDPKMDPIDVLMEGLSWTATVDPAIIEALRPINPEISELLAEARRRKLGPRRPIETPAVIKWIDSKYDFEQHQPRRRKVWAALGVCSWFFTFCCGKKLTRISYNYECLPILCVQLLYLFTVGGGYAFLLDFLYHMRDPLHYVLPRSHKQLLDSTFVLFSYSWVYYTTDDTFDLSMTVPLLCLNVVPCLNLWLNFDDNFGFFDCCLLILIEAALLFCRDRGVVVLMAVAVVGLVLQFIKNAYHQYCADKIKNQTLQYLVLSDRFLLHHK